LRGLVIEHGSNCIDLFGVPARDVSALVKILIQKSVTVFSFVPRCQGECGWIESFNGRMRDEHLNSQLFDSLLKAQVFTEDWRIDYNNNRFHSAYGWLTPVEFVEAWLHRQQQPQLA
jgi:hypothetical protein